MTNKTKREKLNKELIESISIELEGAVVNMYKNKFCAEYVQAYNNNTSKIVVQGAHPSERVECDLDKKIMTYYSGFAASDRHLHLERISMFCNLLIALSCVVERTNDSKGWEIKTMHVYI